MLRRGRPAPPGAAVAAAAAAATSGAAAAAAPAIAAGVGFNRLTLVSSGPPGGPPRFLLLCPFTFPLQEHRRNTRRVKGRRGGPGAPLHCHGVYIHFNARWHKPQTLKPKEGGLNRIISPHLKRTFSIFAVFISLWVRGLGTGAPLEL